MNTGAQKRPEILSTSAAGMRGSCELPVFGS